MTDVQNPARADADLTPALESLLESFRAGKRVALARAISLVENERPGFQAFLHRLLVDHEPGGGRIGITGPPGAGKSSLVTELALRCRERDEEVGVVAVDPTSPFSGGALLGDRIRMNELATDPGIFIRSMASRGSLGGLATTTKEVLDVMDAFAFPRIIVETVGVGQAELEITGAADTVVVVLVPESGDAIQAMKAGLMEIADIFVVNKADRPGADRLVREIRTSLNLREGRGMENVPAHHGVDQARVGEKAREGEGVEGKRGERTSPENESQEGQNRERESPARKGTREGAAGPRGKAAPAGGKSETWRPPVLLTTAHSGEGVEELLDEVDRHRAWMEESGELERRRRERDAARIRDVLDREVKRRVRRVLAEEEATREALARIARGEATPYSVASEFLERLGMDPDDAPLP